ncbi:hypothetical protein [Corynebacterium sp. AOP12-C2-36]|uniref:hypothetical protein n=1 Tax=Corynebacterium sp. AOP12-C2-36 TaxID=3457723 RepID=UPI0040335A44
MYAKPKAVAWTVLGWAISLGVLLGGAYLLATYTSGAIGFKNALLRWGLATLDAGDGFLAFGEGTQVHVTWAPMLCWILLAAIPAAGVYAVVSTRKGQAEVDMDAAVNAHVQPPAPPPTAVPQQGMQMGYPGMQMGYPGMAPQQQIPGHMAGGAGHMAGGAGQLPANPGGG